MNGPSTVTGLGGTASYAGLSPANLAQFESLIGSSLALAQGSGFHSVAVVPEPSTYLLVCFAGAGLYLLRRRRARAS